MGHKVHSTCRPLGQMINYITSTLGDRSASLALFEIDIDEYESLRGNKSKPDEKLFNQIETTYVALLAIINWTHDLKTTKEWFMSHNDQLDGDAPFNLIQRGSRADRIEVMNFAMNFCPPSR